MGKFIINQPRRVSRKKIIIPIIVILALVGVGIFIFRSINSPAEGIVSQTPPDSSQDIDPYASPGTYSGKYISFEYPADYKPMPSTLSGIFVEVDYFYGTKDKSKQISVDVSREALGDDSGLAYRREHPELYKPTAAAGGVIIFTGVDGHERTAYLEHAGLVVSVAVSSSNLNDLTSDSQTVVSSLKWK